MRLRFAVLVSVLFALAAAVPGATEAAPHHNRGLTINATPNPINAGDAVLIYGQLNGQPLGGQTILLYQHVAGSHQGYTLAGQTTTQSNGFYSFDNIAGVESNTSYFTKESGAQGVHSRTVDERVAALVSIAANPTTADTSTPITFSGQVTPNQAGHRVLLQEQNQKTGDWHTLKTGELSSSSSYSISYRWRTPGVRDVRALFPGDGTNIAGASDGVTVTIQQSQVPGFTIQSSQPIIPEGSSVQISGVLENGATTSVTLWARRADEAHFRPVQSMVTGSDGSYAFGQMPTVNMLYQVRTTFAPKRHTAVLFEGVRDVVSLTPSSTTSTVGGVVTFSGNVDPDKAGRMIHLQRLGSDGDWHTVETVRVRFDSTFHFGWRFARAGSFEFRARIYSDEHNVGAASPPVTITVTGMTPVTVPPTK